ncbi:hypothetical protein HLB23_31550 [Nocardia uniformis]|uniref:Uncharacterized protein n=1 Tax=Nocardia uniformis TaxID=53432 RepID=A0A849C6N7_9NOCA|nr:hypothetical protein [Nocardia uniformis]NNH74334.1 hypothetical protein [Nocardia uniformis]
MSERSEHFECRVTIDGAAPSLVPLLRAAARIAAEHGRNVLSDADVYAALIASDDKYGYPPLWWPRVDKPRITRDWKGSIGKDAEGNMLTSELQGETVPLSYPEFRDYVTEWVPGPTPPGVGPASAASVTYEISGAMADEFKAMIERS